MRFWREFWNPSLKCNRLGHVDRPITKRIRRKAPPFTYRTVVEDFEATFIQCKRCGKETGPNEEKIVDSFTSCSMPDTMWDEMRNKGYTVI